MRRKRWRETLTAYVYLLPASVVLFVFHLLPVAYAFWISLHEWKVKKVGFLGLQNYARVFQDPDFWASLRITVFYVLGTIPIQLVLALIIAYLLYQKIRGLSIYRTVYFLPYITSTVAAAAVWLWIFNPGHGPMNQILQVIGIPPQKWMNEPRGVLRLIGGAFGLTVPKWAEGPSLALVAVMIFSVWRYVGYDIVIFLAGLGNIPTELYDAAKIDGAGRGDLFWHITLPLLSPTTYFLAVMSTIWAFQAFSSIYVMTWASGGKLGGPLGKTTTTTIYIFDEFYNRINFGYAASMAFVLFWIIFGLTILQRRIGERRVFYG